MEYLDPKNTIRHVLSRQHCIIVNKYYYLKNLDVLGRDLSQVVFVDVQRILRRTMTWPGC